MKRIKKHISKFRKHITTLVVSALGLFLALQYNTIIASWINTFFPKGGGMLGQVIYLLILTIVVVLIMTWIEKGQK